MKKKGFTLFETIIVLFIILTLFLGTISIGSFENKIYKNIEYEGFLYEAHDFITCAKLRSKIENKSGSLIIEPSENSISYVYDNSDASEFVVAPKGIEILSKELSIPISASGRINKACSIEFQNYFEELKSIKIRVGVDYINLNEDK